MKYRIRWESKNFDDMSTLMCLSGQQLVSISRQNYLHWTSYTENFFRWSTETMQNKSSPQLVNLLSVQPVTKLLTSVTAIEKTRLKLSVRDSNAEIWEMHSGWKTWKFSYFKFSVHLPADRLNYQTLFRKGTCTQLSLTCRWMPMFIERVTEKQKLCYIFQSMAIIFKFDHLFMDLDGLRSFLYGSCAI